MMSYIWIQVELAMESREQELTDILGSENADYWTSPSFIFSGMMHGKVSGSESTFNYVLKILFWKKYQREIHVNVAEYG